MGFHQAHQHHRQGPQAVGECGHSGRQGESAHKSFTWMREPTAYRSVALAGHEGVKALFPCASLDGVTLPGDAS